MVDSLAHLSTNALWFVFGAIVLAVLFLDLCVFHRKSEKPTLKNTIHICLGYMGIAFLFGLFIIFEKGADTGWLYFTGYLVEFSLSLDNIFVMSLVFTSMRVPEAYQHRVLFWGVLGAVVMRAVMILLGEQLVSSFHGVLYLFSGFLIYTGLKMLFGKEEESDDISQNRVVKFLKRFVPVTRALHKDHFFILRQKKIAMTPLFLTLLTIELMDVVFAIDSIPAIFLITQDVFVIYTSNIFAILGLRSLYFLLAAAVNRFAHLQQALSLVLIFIGSKIFLPFVGITVSNVCSLSITLALLSGGVILSLRRTGQALNQ